MKPKILVTRAVFPEVIERLSQHFDVEANQDDNIFDEAELARRLPVRFAGEQVLLDGVDAAPSRTSVTLHADEAAFLAEPGGADEAFVGVRSVRREAQGLLPEGDGAFRIAEPREPAAELAAFAGGEAVRDLELQLHGVAETGEARVAGVEVVDEFGGAFEFMAARVQAGALEEGEGFGFGADVGFGDDRPLLEGRAFVAFLGGLGGVVHGEQDDGQAGLAMPKHDLIGQPTGLFIPRPHHGIENV